ncbi:hypothetical protein [Aliarcobacter butzleri]|uniref:hypothetical protein n=1 Tax=Aliarcobacter butzleri TaxID=28197 RepID=UPI002B2510D3|nr:hypothetical protein [Aliarcobacter butzleri]
MKVKYLEKFYVAGITVRTNNATELNEETAEIPQLWQRYIDESVGTHPIWPPRAFTFGQLTHNDLASVRIPKRATKSL